MFRFNNLHCPVKVSQKKRCNIVSYKLEEDFLWTADRSLVTPLLAPAIKDKRFADLANTI